MSPIKHPYSVRQILHHCLGSFSRAPLSSRHSSSTLLISAACVSAYLLPCRDSSLSFLTSSDSVACASLSAASCPAPPPAAQVALSVCTSCLASRSHTHCLSASISASLLPQGIKLSVRDMLVLSSSTRLSPLRERGREGRQRDRERDREGGTERGRERE